MQLVQHILTNPGSGTQPLHKCPCQLSILEPVRLVFYSKPVTSPLLLNTPTLPLPSPQPIPPLLPLLPLFASQPSPMPTPLPIHHIITRIKYHSKPEPSIPLPGHIIHPLVILPEPVQEPRLGLRVQFPKIQEHLYCLYVSL